MIRLLLFLLLVLAANPALAGESIVAGLSQKRIAITANFDGSEILIFGAVKREAPPPGTGPLQVVITVAGPAEPVTVRRKAKRAGIWVNTDAVEIDSAPSFYAVATTDAFDKVLKQVEDLRHKVSIDHVIRSVGAPMNITDSFAFTDALIRIRSRNGLYQVRPGSVTLTDETLFQTAIDLPANLTEGPYKARIFLTRDGNVIDEYETTIDVRKVGLERFLFKLAHEQPLYYGLLSLAIAIAAGWGASSIFAYFRR